MKSARRIILFICLMFTGNMALGVIETLIPSVGYAVNHNIFMALALMELLYIFPALPLYMRITGQKLGEVTPLKPLGWKNAGYIVLMTVLIDPAASLLSALTSLYFPNAAAAITAGVTPENWPAALIGIAAAPAAAEEICMRGAVLSASRHMPAKLAAAVNGLIFGLIHLNPQQIPYAVFIGVIFAFFVIYTQSIFASILAHFLVNAASVALSLLPAQNNPGPPSDYLPALAVYALVFFLCFLFVFKRFRVFNFNRGV